MLPFPVKKWNLLSCVWATLQRHGLYSPWNSPGQNSGVGSLSLLQGIFPTQWSNPGLPRCRWILYHLSHKGNPPFPIVVAILARDMITQLTTNFSSHLCQIWLYNQVMAAETWTHMRYAFQVMPLEGKKHVLPPSFPPALQPEGRPSSKLSSVKPARAHAGDGMVTRWTPNTHQATIPILDH